MVAKIVPDVRHEFRQLENKMQKIKTFVARFHQDEEGVTLVEYGVAIALAVGVGTAALSALGVSITGAMSAAGSAMPA